MSIQKTEKFAKSQYFILDAETRQPLRCADGEIPSFYDYQDAEDFIYHCEIDEDKILFRKFRYLSEECKAEFIRQQETLKKMFG